MTCEQWAKSPIASATRQAHWQAHKTNRTEANLVKESALFQRTGNTLRFDTDPHYR